MPANVSAAQPGELAFQMDLLYLNRQLATFDAAKPVTGRQQIELQAHEAALAAMRSFTARG